MNNDITIILPLKAEAYVYDLYWSKAGKIHAPKEWHYNGVTIPAGEWLCLRPRFDYHDSEQGYASRAQYQCDRLASGLHPSWAIQHTADQECYVLLGMQGEWTTLPTLVEAGMAVTP